MLEGRMIGLDIGDVRIGVAVSDGLGITAQPREVIAVSTPEKDIAVIRAIIEETRAVRIVAGLPLDREGKAGHQAQKVLGFLDQLRATIEIPIVMQDERFTTASVQRSMIAADVSRKKRKQIVDKLAAQQILQAYLDRQAHERKYPST